MNDSFSIEIEDGIFIGRIPWQVLEYFIENRDNTYKMLDISTHLGIPQSSFSKIVRKLVDLGFLERYAVEGNRKEIIIRPTEKAIEYYKVNSASNVSKTFISFFEYMDRFTDEEISAFTKGLDILTDSVDKTEQQPKTVKYIKLE